MISLVDLPTLNATLNGTSAVLLALGYFFIRRKQVNFHKACMTGAFVTSTLFLVSYLIYHYHAGSRSFSGVGWTRPVYFAILISHTVLATVIVPLPSSRWRAPGEDTLNSTVILLVGPFPSGCMFPSPA